MSIVFIITAAYFFLSLSFTRQNIVKTIEQDLTLAIDIANDLVATKIKLLKSEADTVAERLLQTDSIEGMAELMESQLAEFPDFISLTVYDSHSIVANSGEPVSHDVLRTENSYIQVAFNGERIISSAHFNNLSGSLVMHVFVPMGNSLVLSATFPGMLFADLVTDYRLWRTGNIFMLDGTGTTIADVQRELVIDQRNFILEPDTGPDFSGLRDFLQIMITTEDGMGTYFFNGVERLCIYKHVTGSLAGWRIAIAAPLSESPLLTLRNDLLYSALCFLLAGIVISILLSGIVSRPFYQIEEQNRHLEELNEQVMSASEAKSTFLARMSHEMRTPLNAIIGLSDLSLEGETLSEDDYINLERIYSAGETLLSLVNDILDISKIEAGKFELIPIEYDIPSLLNDTITQNIIRKGEKPIRFILDIDKNLPARLYGDDLRVRQIFNNLLSNAFKYTREGTVEMSIGCVKTGDAVWLTAAVKDTGIGIKSGNIGRLFENFVQLDTTSHRTIEGTGLGLSITKKMVEMMDGSISVESEFGKGSTFRVRLKQGFVSNAVIGEEVAESLKNFNYSDQRRRKYSRMSRVRMPYAKVLVVDDVTTNLDVARGMMKPYGMQVDCVTSGQEAITLIRAQDVQYSAIFMDHMMPEMDGIEATRIIREEIGTEYAKTIPVIALTANAIVGNEQMFLEKGFQAFLSKPINVKRLDAALNEWVRDKEKEKLLDEWQIHPASERRARVDRRSKIDRRIFDDISQLIDMEKGIERFGDEESFYSILRSFAVNTRPLLEVIKRASRESMHEYAITVHGIKSSSRGICVEAVGSLAEALEKAAKEGNYDYIEANNAVFVEAVERLIDILNDMLAEVASAASRPTKDMPDGELLKKLAVACEAFKMDDVDAAMEEIERFEYEAGKGLVAWLRENVELMNFSEIVARLSNESTGG
ncbi:MAG: ATP-binding protein [Treponema sp.]|nr:ATP-binding protein [Treponema sp.]